LLNGLNVILNKKYPLFLKVNLLQVRLIKEKF
jgi:hypothetical protein